MKKLIFLLLFLAATSLLPAQDFAPVGSIWHYTQGTVNPEVTSFKTLESVSDTVIDGTGCRKIVEVERYLDTASVSYRYMYSHNDSVFVWSDGSFHLLYDFGADAGDTIVLGYHTADGGFLKMIIDSTGTIDVNGEQRKIQHITCGDGLIIEFGHHVIEGIGNTSFMFPTPDGYLDGPLRCYEDAQTGLFLNPLHPASGWHHEDCEEIITGIGETEQYNFILLPNPVTHGQPVEVQTSLKITRIKIISISGVVVDQYEFSVDTNPVIQTKSLKPGFYLLQMITESGEMISRKVLVK